MEVPLSGSIVFVPDPGRRLHLLAVALLILLTGCGPAEVVVKGNFPTPLMQKMPITLGVWYSDDFAKHEFF